jgi:hypothetical protein
MKYLSANIPSQILDAFIRKASLDWLVVAVEFGISLNIINELHFALKIFETLPSQAMDWIEAGTSSSFSAHKWNVNATHTQVSFSFSPRAK